MKAIATLITTVALLATSQIAKPAVTIQIVSKDGIGQIHSPTTINCWRIDVTVEALGDFIKAEVEASNPNTYQTAKFKYHPFGPIVLGLEPDSQYVNSVRINADNVAMFEIPGSSRSFNTILMELDAGCILYTDIQNLNSYGEMDSSGRLSASTYTVITGFQTQDDLNLVLCSALGYESPQLGVRSGNLSITGMWVDPNASTEASLSVPELFTPMLVLLSMMPLTLRRSRK